MKNAILKTHLILLGVSVMLSGLAGAARGEDPGGTTYVITCQKIVADNDDGGDNQVVVSAHVQSDEDAPATVATPATPEPPNTIVIQGVEPVNKKKHRKEVAWLGLGVEDASEVVASQLGLKSGEGLTVTLVAAGSPAAKADFHNNDVLVEIDGQMLVDYTQMRKLIQMHAEGDTVNVTYFRAGKKQTTPVKLGKTTWIDSSGADESESLSDLQNLQSQLDGLTAQFSGVGKDLEHIGVDKSKIELEVKRTMDQTRKAIQDSVNHATTERRSLAKVSRDLEALARDGVDVDKDATVIVRNKHNSNKTMLQSDDTGTYIIEAGKKTLLTARDANGKLLFEGEIDTAAQRAKVPKEVWDKAEPMFDKIGLTADNDAKAEIKSDEKPKP